MNNLVKKNNWRFEENNRDFLFKKILSSVEFCHQVGLNYVSCSPFRVLTARLAAAQAAAADQLKVEGGRTK